VPAISILLPLFNGAAFLREQVDSILGQTWTDFELIAIDDGSSDGSAEITADYAKQDRRVRMLPSSGNEGQKYRLLELLRASRSPFIAFADQDDIWHADKMRRLVDGLGDAGLAFGRSELIDAAGSPLGRSLIENLSPLPTPGDRLIQLFIPRISGHALLVRRELVIEMAFSRYHPFDWLVGLDALFARGVTYVDDAITYHRLHGGNQSNDLTGPAVRHLRPAVLRAKLRAGGRARFDFFQSVEHLAHSTVLDGPTRRRFARLAQICGGAWFQFRPGKTPPLSARELREAMLSLLEPLAGSEGDWSAAVDHVTRLTRSWLHPTALYRHARALIVGPETFVARRDSASRAGHGKPKRFGQARR
jgi:glycosyltransferase involved in cell wall biosynthesis